MNLRPPKTGELLVRCVGLCAHKGRGRGVERHRQHRHARYGHEMIYVDYGGMRLIVETHLLWKMRFKRVTGMTPAAYARRIGEWGLHCTQFRLENKFI